MYQYSNYSGKIRNTITFDVFIKDDRNENFLLFLEWQSNDENEIEIVDYFENEEQEYNRYFMPKCVSQRQLRTQLVLNGFDLDSIQTAINSLTEPNKSIAQIAWDYAITFERDSPLLMCLATNLGLTQNEVDTIFLNASKL